MPKSTDYEFPGDSGDERELLLTWLDYLRGAVIRNIEGVSDDDARTRPDGRLLPLAGIVNHLTNVEYRWIDGGMLGAPVERHQEEFFPGPDLTVDGAVAAYLARGERTDRIARSSPLDTPSVRREGVTLRWVLVHLINETARHAGHADAVRELIDGSIGE